MFGVSGLRIDQLRRGGTSRLGIAAGYAAWSFIWIAAHLAGGALPGAILGALGSRVAISPAATAWILAGVLALGGLHHLGLIRLPMPQMHRQVARHWMAWPLGWTAVGYGVQLGSAVSTRITNFATYAALAASFLSHSAAHGAVTMMVFAFFRSLPAVFTGPVASTPQRSFALAIRMGAWEEHVHRWSGALLLLLAGLLATVERSPK